MIGNGNYSIPGLKLVNPSNDAVAMQNELQAAGFTVVMKLDAKRKDFYSLVRQFGDKLAGDPHAVGLFYYAGHGVQADGQNYLIPVDAEIKSEEDLDANAYPAARILHVMKDARNEMNIVILDACRDNSLPRKFRDVERGLARMEGPGGTFIAYAAAPGESARDGNGSNGVFTGELIKAMAKPGVPLEQMYKKVIAGVKRDTRGEQTPWSEASLEGDFYFHPGPLEVPASATVGPAAGVAPMPVPSLRKPKPPPPTPEIPNVTGAAVESVRAAAPAPAAAAYSAGAGWALLRLSFSADSWVDVRDALGNRAYAGNGSANTVKTIAGNAPLHVYLRSANGVKVEINGRAVAILPQYFTGDVARFEAGADGILRREAPRSAARCHPARANARSSSRLTGEPFDVLTDPDVPIDTHHLERALRVMPMGRKSWLFCWTELGAKHVGVIQSLIVTCRLHGIDAYTYLVDVLQRISEHPANRVAELTPRQWKHQFAANPLRSDISEFPV